jgi:dTDP-4-amino-4,6-dideoxygalactose transaminase
MKAALSDFAILGGRPAFAEPLHVGRPNVGDAAALQDRMRAMLERRWLTNDGPLVREFEARIAEAVGVEHCVALSSATTALEVLVRAAELEGEVLLPSFTFVGTAHAMLWSGLTPRFCDIDETHRVDPARVRESVGPQTSAIVAVHVWGQPCRIESLAEIAAENGLRLFFDAAHAFAGSYRGRMIGGFGDAEVFSFHATKIVNSFEGGAITTNDGELAERARLLRNFGFAGYDTVTALGTNGKMSEASAAMGLTSLDSVSEFVATNRRNYRRYQEGFSGLPGVTLVRGDPGERWNHHYVVVEIDAAAAGLTRDDLYRVLRAEGVLARRYFYPGAHAMEPYRTRDPQAGRLLPRTNRLVERVLCLPTGTALGSSDVDKVCALIRAALDQAPEILRRLAPPGAIGPTDQGT